MRLARFWAGVLDRPVLQRADGALMPGDDSQVDLRFVAGATEKTGQNRLHLHLTSTTLDDQQQTVATVLRLGGRHYDVGQRPEEGHVVLADPDDNEFCVIEPGNSFLAGCGLLGELACDGTRDVGLFWSKALDWPLVWDQDEETSIQSPHGGTKVSWGGPPVAPPVARPTHRFHVQARGGDLDGEAERLVALGATVIDAGTDGAVVMTDPDGTPFDLSTR